MIRQNNAELEELRNQYENLDICEEDKQVEGAMSGIAIGISGILTVLFAMALM